MLTAAKLVLPALVAALFVWGAAWCVVRTLRPQMADTAAVGGEPPRSSKAMAALAGLLFVCVLQLVFCHAAQANNPGVGSVDRLRVLHQYRPQDGYLPAP